MASYRWTTSSTLDVQSEERRSFHVFYHVYQMFSSTRLRLEKSVRVRKILEDWKGLED